MWRTPFCQDSSCVNVNAFTVGGKVMKAMVAVFVAVAAVVTQFASPFVEGRCCIASEVFRGWALAARFVSPLLLVGTSSCCIASEDFSRAGVGGTVCVAGVGLFARAGVGGTVCVAGVGGFLTSGHDLGRRHGIKFRKEI
jgi:hypothetical protein